ncbi:MAG: phosphotransferase [Candidatus Nomurabacteria bacterium]|nr:phosphotransferase [Candidatus Nomurabacteria bacterium]
MENPPKKQTFKLEKVQKIVENKATEDLLACLDVLELRAVSIGEGGNAEVLIAEGTPFEKVCLKRIKNKQQILCNEIDEENKFQIKAQEAGVRTPLPLMSLKTDKGDCFLMERIEGYSMKDIIEKPERLPKKFKYNVFFNSLKEQIDLMHKTGIYHRDLHWGNVMVDKKGLPVIIDFGTAIYGTGSDSTYEESATVYNENLKRYELRSGIFIDDLVSFKNLSEQFKSFM